MLTGILIMTGRHMQLFESYGCPFANWTTMFDSHWNSILIAILLVRNNT
jgi:hypothetical protein